MPSEFAKYAQSMDVGLPQSMIDLLDNLDLGDIASDRFDNESDSDDDDDDGDNDGYKPGAPITEVPSHQQHNLQRTLAHQLL